MNRFDVLEGHYSFYTDFAEGYYSDYSTRLRRLVKFYNPGNQFQGYDDLSEDGVKVYHKLAITHYERKLKDLPNYNDFPILLENVFETLLAKTFWNPVNVVVEDSIPVMLRILVEDFQNKIWHWELKTKAINPSEDNRGFWAFNIVFSEHRACDLIRIAYELSEEALIAAIV